MGKIISIDFKQLEVVVFAFLTQDRLLIKDIVDGVDIHRRLASKVYGITEEKVTKQQRQIIKAGTFSLIYGGGVNKIAATLDIPIEIAEKLKFMFFDRYKTAETWQRNLVEQVNDTAVEIEEFTPKGFKKRLGYYKSISGRLLKFKTKDSPKFMVDRGVMTSFNPPDIKDYPVQSLATSDIVLIFLGKLWRKLLPYRDKVLLTNTTHDDILLDCRENFVQETCNLVKNEVYLIPEWLKRDYHIDFNLPLNVDIKVSDSWGDCGL